MCTNPTGRDIPRLRTGSTLLLLVLFAPFLIGSAQADLVPGLGDLDKDMNNAVQFNPSVRTLVTVAYRDPNLPLSRFIQLGFRTTAETPFQISSLAWSFDNLSFTPFAPYDAIENINSPVDYAYSPIIDLSRFIGGSPNARFYIRYVLPPGLDEGTIVQSKFLSNSNSFAVNGVLSEEVGNNFVSLTRQHTAIPEPSSIVLMLIVGFCVIHRSFLAAKKQQRLTYK
jgi:hypothetical protein